MTEHVRQLRSLVGSMRLLLPTTSAVIRNDAGGILLQRRSDNGLWGLPGGFLEVGETVTECLRREVREETGLQVLEHSLLAVLSGPAHEVTYPNGDRTAPVVLVFAVDSWKGELRAEGESTDLRFFDPRRLPSELGRVHRPAIEIALSRESGRTEAPHVD